MEEDMGAPIMTLVLRRLVHDAVDIMELVDEQLDLVLRGKNRRAIRLGDMWITGFAHVPHALLFDMWSARAEVALWRPQRVALRLLRADIVFRRWERAIVESRFELDNGERLLIGQLIGDFCDTLAWIKREAGNHEYVGLLLGEYRARAPYF